MNDVSISTNIRAPFSARLDSLFLKLDISPEHYAELGEKIAQAQPGRHVPYHPATIHSWRDGSLLPSAAAFTALKSVLGIYAERSHTKIYDIDLLLHFLDGEFATSQTLQQKETYQPTELTHALQLARRTRGYSYQQLAQEAKHVMAKYRASDADGFIEGKESTALKLPTSSAAYNYTLGGRVGYAPSKQLVYFMQRLADQAELSLPNACALHEQELRDRADLAWQKAVASNPIDFGQMIHACRLRLGEAMEPFGQRVYDYIGYTDVPASSAMVSNWENNYTLPGCQYIDTPPIVEAMIDLFKIADVAPNRLSRSIDEPWFDETKEKIFRKAFMEKFEAHEHFKNYDAHRISRDPSPAPDLRDVQPHLQVTRASLNGLLTNGIPSIRKH